MSAAPPDVFISYAREDVEWVGPLAAELVMRGRSVFWDRRIPAGQSWHSYIGKAVKAARCVVVVWSEHSIVSDWVLEEAGQGKRRRALVPLLKEPVEPPIGFGLIQAADLSGWRRGEPSEEFAAFLDDLASLLGPPPHSEPLVVPSIEGEPGTDGLIVAPATDDIARTAPEKPAFAPAIESEVVAVAPTKWHDPIENRGRTPLAEIGLPSPEPAEEARPQASADVHAAAWQGHSPPDAPVELVPAPGGSEQSIGSDGAEVGDGALARVRLGPPSAPVRQAGPIACPSRVGADRPTLITVPTRHRGRPVAVALVGAIVVGGGIYAFTRQYAEPPSVPAASVPTLPPVAELDTPLVAAPPPSDAEAALRLSRDDWQAVQLALRAQGFDPGPADGFVGPKTRQAVTAWQRRSGTAATGYLAEGEAEQIRGATRIAGETFTDTLADGSPCPFCPEMVVVVSAGSFTMGSSEAERKWVVEQGGQEDGYTDELPADDPEWIPAKFALGRTEVTRGQFMQFVDATKRKMSGGCNSWTGSEWKLDPAKDWDDVGFKQGDDHPMVCVSWEDATDYAAWLSQQTGLNYQLPSEAEWEYAARAESLKMRFWGDDKANQDACRYANVADQSYKETLNRGPIFACDDGFPFTSPTAKYEPNGFALYDTLGGVWEWNQDCYRDSYRKNPPENADCNHVVRGSSWDGYPRSLRSANRQSFAPNYRSNNTGLRVARMLTP